MGRLAKLRNRQQRRGEEVEEIRKNVGSAIMDMFWAFNSLSEADIRRQLKSKGVSKVDLPAELEKLKQRGMLVKVSNSTSMWAKPLDTGIPARRQARSPFW